MLSVDDNKLITQVGPGTPMGEVFRRYWIPALMSSEVPTPDCPPVKVRLLGEDLVAFRATSGKVGLIDTWCPHRNANLFWGRNEEEGLRCVYHGWKFDLDGTCVDMPNEPASSVFANKVKQPAYPTAEGGGLVWVYMGPRDKQPPLPQHEFMDLPPEHVYASKRIQACNFLQNLEGEVDSSHVSFLHSNLSSEAPGMDRGVDKHPVFEVRETEWGLAISARRDAGPNQYYWRITPMMLPSYTIIPGQLQGGYVFTSAIPIDDTNMAGFTVVWNKDSYVQPETGGPTVDVDERFVPFQNKSNDYGIDREDQRLRSFTGIKGIRIQDMAVQEDQRGPVSDRSRVHLGTSDMGVIATRRRLQKQMRDLLEGHEPREPHTPEAFRLHSLAITADRSIPWEQLMREHMVLTKTPLATETAV
jgi:phthalate 4,5-dioxygenase oxygenase subunit